MSKDYIANRFPKFLKYTQMRFGNILCCNFAEEFNPHMQLSELAEIAASVLVSLGGGGVIVLGLSNWLGKVWAERLMEKEKARYQKELEDFKHS